MDILLDCLAVLVLLAINVFVIAPAIGETSDGSRFRSYKTHIREGLIREGLMILALSIIAVIALAVYWAIQRVGALIA